MFHSNIVCITFFIIVSVLVDEIKSKPNYAIFYDEINLQGDSVFMSFSRCTNLPNNFNEKISSLDNRKNCILLWDNECCQGRSIEINSHTQVQNDLSVANFDNTATSVSPCGNYTSENSELFLQETWPDHAEFVERVYEDEDVTIYIDTTINRRFAWFHQFIGNAWRYVKKSYGYFGPDFGRLTSVFHAESDRNSLMKSYFESASYCRNILDLSSAVKNGWNEESVENTDSILKEMSKFVLTASKGVSGSPVQTFWNSTTAQEMWAQIFVYDVYEGLGLQSEAERWFNLTENSSSDFPRQNTYWFRNWFSQIYKRYGKTKVLNEYFSIVSENFPRNSARIYEYDGEMTLEEFVHFWSGAAGRSLRETAGRTFGWDVTSEYLLVQAQLKYPIKYETI